jgi:hypothetical protein
MYTPVHALTRAINRLLRRCADEHHKLIPSASFLSDARRLANTWPDVFLVNKKLPYATANFDNGYRYTPT